ncbi:MAG: nuclear transport factor 2 family protein [Anaerolineae bacterium]|nr:nuclear transport factor 2 family protein [Anaerolineae bacterium]
MYTDDITAEVQAIKQAILDYYHEGHAKHDAKYYEPILHPDWRFMILDESGQPRIITRDEYLLFYDPKDRNPDLEWETEFYSVDVTGNFASVKLRIECQTVRYIDYFHMMKIDGTWWIVHKMSHGENKAG